MKPRIKLCIKYCFFLRCCAYIFAGQRGEIELCTCSVRAFVLKCCAEWSGTEPGTLDEVLRSNSLNFDTVTKLVRRPYQAVVFSLFK